MKYYYNLRTDNILNEREFALYIIRLMKSEDEVRKEEHWHQLDICLSEKNFIDYFNIEAPEWD